MKSERKPRYNWEIYFDEKKSDKAAFRTCFFAALTLGAVAAIAAGAFKGLHYLGKTHGLIWLLVPFGAVLLCVFTYYLWPDKYKE